MKHIEHIIIPTLGRCDKQITYNNLPNKYQDITKFVVQQHEFDIMNNKYPGKVLCLPENIKSIAPTREWIFNNFNDTIFWVFDDDLDFVFKRPNKEEGSKWITRSMNELDFDIIFNEYIDHSIEIGYHYGALSTTWIIPEEKHYPTRENYRIMTNVFYNGPEIPRDLEWFTIIKQRL